MSNVTKTHKCPKCAKSYISEVAVKRHLRRHDDHLKCSCSKVYTKLYNLKQHMRICTYEQYRQQQIQKRRLQLLEQQQQPLEQQQQPPEKQHQSLEQQQQPPQLSRFYGDTCSCCRKCRSWKITLLSLLTHGELDNGHSFAGQRPFRYKQEMESEPISPVENDVLGFDGIENVVIKLDPDTLNY